MKKRLLSTFIFIVYSLILIKVMVFKNVPIIRTGSIMLNFGGTNGGHPANFIPFKTILPYLLGDKGWTIAGINLVGNIALLIPIGFLVPFMYRKMTWKKSLILAIASGLIIEVMQVVLHVGIFDIDDVLLNAFGVIVGYWTFVILAKWFRERKYISIIIATIIVIIAGAATLYVIYPRSPQAVNPRAVQSDYFNNGEGEIPQSDDLCNGTGGTGEIVSVENNKIILKRNDNSMQTIQLTDQTIIKTTTGSSSISDLKSEDRVTIVIYDNKTATAVLVCNTQSE